MPGKSEKTNIINFLSENALNEIKFSEEVDSDSDDSYIGEIIDDYLEDIACVLSCRRGVENFIPKSVDWRVNVLPTLDDGCFRQMLRVDRNQFQYLLSLIENDKSFQVGMRFPTELQLAITLYRLGCSGENASIRKVASKFGVGDGGTLEKVTKRVFDAFIRIFPKYVFWPDSEERAKIVEETFNELPNCIGYVDGTEIDLAETPAKNHELYFSGKLKYSVKVQIICDHKRRIRNVVVGNPGCFHDARIFRSCTVYRNQQNFFTGQQYIVGDSAYPLSNVVITPYQLTNSPKMERKRRVQFNKHLSKFRIRVEHCIGLLKERFGSLKQLRFRMKDDKSASDCNRWILVCCLLHNILLNEQDVCDVPLKADEDGEELTNAEVKNSEYAQFEAKRQFIYNAIFN